MAAGIGFVEPPHPKFALFYQILHKNTPFLGEEKSSGCRNNISRLFQNFSSGTATLDVIEKPGPKC
jgi:hypothetical protein